LKTLGTPFAKECFTLDVAGTHLEVSAIHRDGPRAPVVFLHGFGSTKEDYADLVHHADFHGRPFLAFDAPGCGETICSDLLRISIPFLVATAETLLDRVGFEHFHLVGHSMGGLTALLLAESNPERVLSFTNIEGNLASEDCFLSRQIVGYETADPTAFFEAFIARTYMQSAFSSALYAATLRNRVRAGAVRGIFTSMVELSDNRDLMSKFIGLPCPKTFMYGDQNSGLSYLGHLSAQGVHLACIAQCGHFPMYSNPPAMWDGIAACIARSSDGR
jgi:pimeloyl-ACP methyl ester carboxylesterase